MVEKPRSADQAEPWWKAPWSSAWVGAAAAVIGTVVTIIALTSGGGGSGPTATIPGDEPATNYAFMYGTMKPGHFFYPEIDEFVAETIQATTRGRLFDSGVGYPAAVFDPSSEQVISGFLLRWVPDLAAAANQKIADIENNLFRPTMVVTDQGIRAIAYEWIGSTDSLTPIPSGNWERENEP